TQLRLSPQLPPPAIQLPGMNPHFPRNRRYAGTRLQRRRNQLPLLRRAPASPTLNRRDDLNPSLSHVTIPMNSHMTHTSTRSARRPLPDGYVKFAIAGCYHSHRPKRNFQIQLASISETDKGIVHFFASG